MAMTDALVLLLMSCAHFYFWRSQEKRRYLIPSFVFLGLAAITKGPVIVAFFGVWGVYLILTRQLKSYLTDKKLWLGLGIFLLIALPWHIYMLITHGRDFYDQYIGYHILKRAREPIEGHVGDGRFYIKLIFKEALPLVSILPLVVFVPISYLKAKWREFLFVSLWLLFEFISVQKVATKVQWYMLPIFIPMAILIAFVFTGLMRRNWLVRLSIIAFTFYFVFLGMVRYYPRWDELKDYTSRKQCLIDYKQRNPDGPYYFSLRLNAPSARFYLGDKIFQFIDLDDKTVQTDALILARDRWEPNLPIDRYRVEARTGECVYLRQR
jgi:4-amino-4-deoxy-L-arabinose transferase-like glycosyltransferase